MNFNVMLSTLTSVFTVQIIYHFSCDVIILMCLKNREKIELFLVKSMHVNPNNDELKYEKCLHYFKRFFVAKYKIVVDEKKELSFD